MLGGGGRGDRLPPLVRSGQVREHQVDVLARRQRIDEAEAQDGLAGVAGSA